jgi:hypothetical protein
MAKKQVAIDRLRKALAVALSNREKRWLASSPASVHSQGNSIRGAEAEAERAAVMTGE